jgi:hypothetical protein
MKYSMNVKIQTVKTHLMFHLLIFWIICCRMLGGEEKGTVEKDRILQEKEAELRRMQEMLAQMQAQMQQQQL